MSPLLLFMVGKFLTKAPPLGARVTTSAAARPEVVRRAVATPAPWPAPVPDDLPSFPAGWEFDRPLRPEVVARAAQLIPSLWARGLGARVVEFIGGRWVTFVAADHAGKRAVEAYRVRRSPPKAPPRRVSPQAVAEHAASARRMADEIRRTSVPAAPPSSRPAPSRPAPAAPVARPAPARPVRRPRPEETPRPDPERDVFVPPPTVRMGSQGPDVTRAQTALNRRGASLRPDGIFGPLTFAAAKTFQRSEGLVVDGIIGPRTWEALLT